MSLLEAYPYLIGEMLEGMYPLIQGNGQRREMVLDASLLSGLPLYDFLWLYPPEQGKLIQPIHDPLLTNFPSFLL